MTLRLNIIIQKRFIAWALGSKAAYYESLEPQGSGCILTTLKLEQFVLCETSDVILTTAHIYIAIVF